MDLTELVDRTLMADTLHAYCDRVDRTDLDGLLALFTEDAVLDLGRTVVAGRGRLRPLLIDLMRRWSTTNHHCSTMSVLRYDGTTADTVTYVYAFHDAPDRDESMHLWGRYEDELRKEAGEWRLRVHRLRIAGVRLTTSGETPERFEYFHREPVPDM